ncbi:radical SAM protein [Sphingobacteriaceae bacterium WQ 2009]|uniref:Radical SAM protein n=2 Tax=Rhinopithecimicrobium faecis TaxID=2820698 RepID=A0A8T4H7I3_9SPHI|nr:radical SAM protein [Sphingobacteriaceae bacterium WQ 2009]
MYNLGDLTYKNQPKIISDEVVDSFLKKLKDYLEKNNGTHFQFIFHGGEPLLAPMEWYKYFISSAEQMLNGVKIRFTLQTNGVLYNEKWANFLQENKIYSSFSWDGPKQIHDKFRVYHNNKGSYDEVKSALALYKSKFGHVSGLTVLNDEVTPSEYYTNVKELGITHFTIIFPQLHHDTDEQFNHFENSKTSGFFGKWLAELFDIWWFDRDKDKPVIHYFANIITLLLGGEATSEGLGSGENNVVVLETNGDIETTTALKSCGPAFTKEGNNILTHTIEESIDSDLIKLFVYSHKEVSQNCKECSLLKICGGGRLNERYSYQNGFDNPSVYCNDYKVIIHHIKERLFSTLTKEEREYYEVAY